MRISLPLLAQVLVLVCMMNWACCGHQEVVKSGSHLSDNEGGFPVFFASGADGGLFVACKPAGEVRFDSANYANTDDFLVICFRPDFSVAWLRTLSHYVDLKDQSLKTGTASQAGNLFLAGTCNERGARSTGAGFDCKDVFVAKMNAAGNMLWQTTFEEAGDAEPSAIAVDSDENIYVAGVSRAGSWVTADGTKKESRLDTFFVRKFDPSGIVLWEEIWSFPRRYDLYSGKWDFLSDLITTPRGEVVACGSFSETRDLDPGPNASTYTSEGYSDCFLVKCDSGGDLQWAATWGGDGQDFATALACDDQSNIYVVGECSGSIFLVEPWLARKQVASAERDDAFLAKFSDRGYSEWVTTWGGSGEERGMGVYLDSKGRVYVEGLCGDGCDLDPGPGRATLPAESDYVAAFTSSGLFVSYSSWRRAGAPCISISKQDQMSLSCRIPVHATVKEFRFGCGDISSLVHEAFILHADLH